MYFDIVLVYYREALLSEARRTEKHWPSTRTGDLVFAQPSSLPLADVLSPAAPSRIQRHPGHDQRHPACFRLSELKLSAFRVSNRSRWSMLVWACRKIRKAQSIRKLFYK
jgi:hypothetical protein